MTHRTATGLGIAAIGILIAVLQYFATQYFWYWEYWWFDIIMHFLGGFFIALFVYWLLRNEWKNLITRVYEFWLVLVLVLIVGVAWEVFEFMFDAYNARNYTLDTTLDMLMDGVGALAAYLIYRRL